MLSTEKLLWSTIGLNCGLYVLSNMSPQVSIFLSHTPIISPNYTLLTSCFGHVGMFHLGFNMYALYNFGLPTATSKTFENSSSHLAAFYLSAGVLSSLAHHLSSAWPQPKLRTIPGKGASGAIFALVGAFAMQYPDAKIGVLFLPFTYIAAQQALALLAAFEAYGLFVGFKTLPFAHGAHLAGIAIGAAYVHFDGKNLVWKPAREIAFKQMRALALI